MAAVLAPRPATAPWNQPHPGRPDPARPHGARPQLRLVEGGRAGAPAEREAVAVVAARPGRRALATVAAGLALAVLVALASLGVTDLLGADAAASGPASTAATPHPAGADASTSSAPAEVVVRPGDSLWTIARRLQPTGDVRPLVDALVERAGGTTVVVGQHLDVTGLGG